MQSDKLLTDKIKNIKQKILLIFLITISTNLIFAQNFVEKRYFYAKSSTVKPTGYYENNLIFYYDRDLYKVTGAKEPVLLTGETSSNLGDNFLFGNGIQKFMLNENEIVVLNTISGTGAFRHQRKSDFRNNKNRD